MTFEELAQIDARLVCDLLQAEVFTGLWLLDDVLELVPKPNQDLEDAAQEREERLRGSGRDADARAVEVGKEHARRGSLPMWVRPWHWLFGTIVGYGHRLWRALLPLAVLVLLGAYLFGKAHVECLDGGAEYKAEGCAMTPTRANDELPDFHSMIYALDTVLPIIDLGQQEFWIPANGYRWVFWTLITAGWILTTSVVAGLTRVLTKGKV
jgi:hypothetical protein